MFKSIIPIAVLSLAIMSCGGGAWSGVSGVTGKGNNTVEVGILHALSGTMAQRQTNNLFRQRNT